MEDILMEDILSFDRLRFEVMMESLLEMAKNKWGDKGKTCLTIEVHGDLSIGVHTECGYWGYNTIREFLETCEENKLNNNLFV